MVTVKCVLNNHNECTVFPVVLFINKSLNEMSEVLYEWPFKAVIKSLLSLVPIITFVLHHCYHELSNALPPLFMRPPRLSGHRWSCLLGPGRDCFGGALLVSKKNKNKHNLLNMQQRQNRWGTAQSRGCSAPAELEEGSWLVEGRLLLSDAWLDSSISPWDTTGSIDTSAPGLNQAKCTSDYVNCDLRNFSHFGEVIETEWNERFQRGRSSRSDKLLRGRGSPISVWLQKDVVSLLPCTGSSWCWCAHHGNRLRGVLCCVGLSHFWENSYWKIERWKQISTFQ